MPNSLLTYPYHQCGYCDTRIPSLNRTGNIKLTYNIDYLGAWEPLSAHVQHHGHFEGPEKAEQIEQWGAHFAEGILLGEKWKEPDFGDEVDMFWVAR